MVEHPHYDRILAVLRAVPTQSFHGTLYRACDPSYANTRDLLTGVGSQKHGGRWNSPAGFPLVYLAMSWEGALAESVGLAGSYGFDPASRLPLTLVAVEASLAQVLDITEPDTRKSLHVTLTAMTTCPWREENKAGRESLTQAIGRAASSLGVDAILVPSAAKRAFRNLNVLPCNLTGRSSLKIRRAHQLPPPTPTGLM